MLKYCPEGTEDAGRPYAVYCPEECRWNEPEGETGDAHDDDGENDGIFP